MNKTFLVTLKVLTFFLIVGAVVFGFRVDKTYAGSCTLSGSGTWSATASFTSGCTGAASGGAGTNNRPGAGDTVTAPAGGLTLTVDVDTPTLTAFTVSAWNTTTATTILTINSGASLNVSGAFTVPQPTANSTQTISISGTLDIGALTFTGTTSSRNTVISVDNAAGKFTLRGTATITSGGAKTIKSTAAGTIELINASLPNSTSLTWGAFAAGTDLISSGTTTISKTTAIATWGDCTISSGTFSTTTGLYTCSGNFTLNGNKAGTGGITLTGASAVISGTGAMTGSGTLTVSGTTGPSIASGSDISIAGNMILGANAPLTVDGDLSVGGTLTINATTSTSKTILTIGSTGSLSVTGTTTFNLPTSAVTSTINVGAGAATFGGMFTMAGSTASAIGKIILTSGTINFNGGVNTSGTTGSTASAHVIDISGGAGTISVKGQFMSANSFTSSGWTFTNTTCSGAGNTFIYADIGNDQSITVPGSGGYCNLTILSGNASLGTAAITTSNVKGNIIIGDDVNTVSVTNLSGTITGGGTKSFILNNLATYKQTNTGSERMPTGFGTITLDPNSTVEYNSTAGYTISSSYTFGNLAFKPTTAGLTFTLPATITINGGVTVGDGTNTVTVTANTNDPVLNIPGSFTVNDGGTFIASSTNDLTVTGNMTIGGGTSGVFTENGGDIDLNGNLTINTGATFTKNASSQLLFTGGTTQTITDNTASKQDLGTVITSTTSTNVNATTEIAATTLTVGSGTTFALSGDFTASGSVSNSGTLNSSGSGALISVGGDWTNTGTISAGTSTIKMISTSSSAVTFAGGGATYNNLYLAHGAGTGAYVITGSNTFNDFKDDGSAAHSILFTAGTTTTVTTFTVSGTAGQLITIDSGNGSGATSTSTHALVKSGDGRISSDYLNIQHSVATPSNTWYAGSHSTDNQSVATVGSGWTFTDPPPQTKFNISEAASSVSGWTNVAGNPANSTPTATDAATGFGFRSTGSSNWNSSFGSDNAQDGFGESVDDGGGFAMPAAVIANYWYNYSDVFTTNKYQTQVFGLNPARTYTLTILGSRGTANGATAPRVTDYNVKGLSVLTKQTVDSWRNTSKTATFSGVQPDASGIINIAINKKSDGTGGSFGYINGVIVTEEPFNNSAPTADAGSDQVVSMPISSISLVGSGSDTDGTIVSYSWSEISSNYATINSTTSASTTVKDLAAGTYTFRLTVTDDYGSTGTDDVVITVNDHSLSSPTAKTIVVLGSSTSAGYGLTPSSDAYVERFKSYFEGLVAGNSVVNLAVSGYTTYDILPTGTTPPGGRPSPDTAHNITQALTYNPDAIIVNMPSNDTANGYTTTEQETNYQTLASAAAAANVPIWFTTTQPRNFGTQADIDKQTTVRDWILATYDTKAIDFWSTFAAAGGTIDPTYDQGDGIHLNNIAHKKLYARVAESTVITIVHDVAPTANAGNDQTVTLPTTTATLSGSGSDSDGSVSAYAWSFISGPSTPSITSASSASTGVTGLVSAGTYVFRLTVTDNLGKTGTDDINVVVNTGGIGATVSYLIDLGRSTSQTSTTGWNNITDPRAASAASLVDSIGGASSKTFQITNSFYYDPGNTVDYSTNINGTTGSSVYPSSATSDSFFLGTLGSVTDTSAAVVIGGLDDTYTYDFKFYASRVAGDSGNRTVNYTIGATTVSLNATDNVNNTVEITGVSPTSSSVTINVTRASGATFGYLGVLEITEHQTTSTDCTSQGTGNWNTAGTWSCGHVPTTADDVTIATGHTVTLDTDSAVLASVVIEGTLNAANASRTISLSGSWTNTGTLSGMDSTTIKMTDNSADPTFAGGDATYYKLWLAPGSDTGSFTITGNNTFTELKDDGSAAHSIKFAAGSTQTITTWNISGTSGNLITIDSTTTATHNLVKPNDAPEVRADYLSIQHSVVSPYGEWYAGENSTNNQNLSSAGSGWVFVTRSKHRGGGGSVRSAGGETDNGTGAGTCADGVQNGNETGVDSGGRCANTGGDSGGGGGTTGGETGNGTGTGTCSDGIKNGNEEGVDQGGRCGNTGGGTGGGGGDVGFIFFFQQIKLPSFRFQFALR